MNTDFQTYILYYNKFSEKNGECVHGDDARTGIYQANQDHNCPGAAKLGRRDDRGGEVVEEKQGEDKEEGERAKELGQNPFSWSYLGKFSCFGI